MKVEIEKLKPYHFNEQFFELLKGDDYEALKQDIAERGIKTELHILPDNTVICGNQRLKIARELGLKEVPCKVIEGLETEDQIKEYVIKDNLLRRQLTPEQAYLLYNELSKIYEKGRGAPKGHFGNIPHKDDTVSSSCEEDVNQITAKVVNKNPRTIARARAYAQALKEHPEWKGKKVTWVLRRLKEIKQEEEIKKLEPEKVLRGVYDVIVVDPPWKVAEGGYDPDGLRGKGDYPVMEVEEIKNIKLPMAKDCVVWLWTIDLHLKDALEVLETWGLERKSTLIWVKDKMGLGHWLRNQHEYCFLATKGKPKWFGGDVSSVLYAPRRKHSEKPDEFYKLVEKVCRGRKLDYFARKKREGWDVYGDEVKL